MRGGTDQAAEDASGDFFNRDIASNDTLLYVDTTQRRQQVKTFGVSDAWWAPGIGTRGNVDELTALLFTDAGIAPNFLYSADIAQGSTLDGGEGMRWTVLETTDRTSELCFALANDPSGNSVQNWTGAKALDFYIDLEAFGNETTGFICG